MGITLGSQKKGWILRQCRTAAFYPAERWGMHFNAVADVKDLAECFLFFSRVVLSAVPRNPTGSVSSISSSWPETGLVTPSVAEA